MSIGRPISDAHRSLSSVCPFWSGPELHLSISILKRLKQHLSIEVFQWPLKNSKPTQVAFYISWKVKIYIMYLVFITVDWWFSSKRPNKPMTWRARTPRNTRSDKPILKWRPGSGNRSLEEETASRTRKSRQNNCSLNRRIKSVIFPHLAFYLNLCSASFLESQSHISTPLLPLTWSYLWYSIQALKP